MFLNSNFNFDDSESSSESVSKSFCTILSPGEVIFYSILRILIFDIINLIFEDGKTAYCDIEWINVSFVIFPLVKHAPQTVYWFC